MVHVRTEIKRPAQEVIDKFRPVSVASVYEASGRKGFIDCSIKPVGRGMKLCGPAFTVQCAPGDNLMLHKALSIAGRGDVLVAAAGGAHEYGYWGEMMAVSARAREIAGLAIDGCIRDSEDIIEMGFPVFARGRCIRGTEKANLGLINHPLNFGGAVVKPGDIILGDDDGLVTVSREDCKDILHRALEREEKEVEKAEVLGSGVTSVDYKNLDKVFIKLGLMEE